MSTSKSGFCCTVLANLFSEHVEFNGVIVSFPMGNAFSTAYDADDRIHICNRCGWFWHKDKSRVRMHQAFGCKRDARYKGGNSTVSISGRRHHQHHQHSACDACEHDAAHDADEQLREAVDAQLEHFIQTTGAELSKDDVAGLSDMLVGILGNGEDIKSRSCEIGVISVCTAAGSTPASAYSNAWYTCTLLISSSPAALLQP